MVNINIAYPDKFKALFTFIFVNLAYATIYFSPGLEHGGQAPLFFLFLLSLPLLLSRKCYQDFDFKFLISLLFVFIAAIPLAIKSGEGEALDAPSRFLIVSVVFIALYRVPINGKWLLRSTMLACTLAFAVACYELATTNNNRVNIGIGILESAYTLSLLVFTCLIAFLDEQERKWKVLALLSLVLGLIAISQTGTRGAWLAILITGIIFLRLISPTNFVKTLLIGSLLCGVTGVAGYKLSKNIEERVDSTVDELTSFGNFDRVTSTNLRLIYWEHAWEGFTQSPLTGLSYEENASLRREFKDRYQTHIVGTDDGRSSSHNEILNAMVQKGIIGLMAILLVYLIPLKHFINKIKSNYPAVKNYAIAGICSISAMIASGLTEAPLMHTSVSVTYGMMLVLLYHAIRNEELRHKETSCSP